MVMMSDAVAVAIITTVGAVIIALLKHWRTIKTKPQAEPPKAATEPSTKSDQSKNPMPQNPTAQPDANPNQKLGYTDKRPSIRDWRQK